MEVGKGPSLGRQTEDEFKVVTVACMQIQTQSFVSDGAELDHTQRHRNSATSTESRNCHDELFTC